MNTRTVSGLTPRKEYWVPILLALVEAGGSLSRHELWQALPTKMTFTEADRELNADGAQKWERVVIFYAPSDMRKEGLLEPAARNGVHISAKGRAYLTNR